MSTESLDQENGLRQLDRERVDLPPDRHKACIEVVKLELQNNHEWAMELRRRMGLQSLIWPFTLMGASLTTQIVNSSAISAVLNSSVGIIACCTLLVSFVSLGTIYGFLERRLWERGQYLRRALVHVLSANEVDEAPALNAGWLAERDFKVFDMRGAYFIQYSLVSVIAVSVLTLMAVMLTAA